MRSRKPSSKPCAASRLFVTQDEETRGIGWKLTTLFVARTPETVEELVRIRPSEGPRTEHEAYARLMGFSQTAIDAFLGRTERLPREEQSALLDDPTVLFQIIHSKSHWKEELEFLRKRSTLIKKYAPALYDKIVAARSRS